MLTHPTLDQMVALGLTGMADDWKALTEQDPGKALDRNEWLGLMLDREATARADSRIAPSAAFGQGKRPRSSTL